MLVWKSKRVYSLYNEKERTTHTHTHTCHYIGELVEKDNCNSQDKHCACDGTNDPTFWTQHGNNRTPVRDRKYPPRRIDK